MSEERKRYLKEKILNEIKELIEHSYSSLEELEDFSDFMSKTLIDMDDLDILKENEDDK